MLPRPLGIPSNPPDLSPITLPLNDPFGPLPTIPLPTIPTVPYPIVSSSDPNGISGTPGVGAAGYVNDSTALGYEITFENLATATAPAQTVVITDQLDPTKVNLSTFSLGPITFGSEILTPPPSSSTYNTVVNLEPGNDLLVEVNAGLNESTGLLTWTFTSLDPTTGQPTTNPLAGFLLPDVTPPEGDGSVFFSVQPNAGLANGTQITDSATITFDNNAPIATSQWLNTIDTILPSVAITSAGGLTNQPNQTISGTATDTEVPVGATVMLYDNGGSLPIGTATVGSDGSWSTTVTLPDEGTNSIVAEDTDAAGNTGISGAVVFDLVTGVIVNPVQTTTCDLSSADNPITFGSGTDIDVTNGGDAVYGGPGVTWTVTNAGALAAEGTGGDGVSLEGGGTLTNQSGGTITGAADGVSITGGAGAVSNAGTISGTSASVEFAGSGANMLTLETGSTLTGDAHGSTASGATNALVLQGTGYENYDFVDFNTLSVGTGGDWTLDDYSTIGTTTVNGDLTVTGQLDTAFAIAAGGTLSFVGGGGTIEEASTRLTNMGTLDIGNGSQTALTPDIVSVASLTNDSTIDLTGIGSKSAELLLTGTLDNAGSFVVANDVEKIGRAVSGKGSFTLDGKSTLQFDSSVGANQTITLDGTDEIALKRAQDFHALIASFGTGGARDSIDAMNFAPGSTRFSSHENSAHTLATLTLTEGAEVVHFHLSGDYVRSDFAVRADAGRTRTLIRFV
jgi:hypothetical protein